MIPNNKEPLVSVGIPTYNRPDGLERALGQLIEQSYENIEFLVSDNCSTSPEVSQIISNYQSKDPRVRYLKQDVNIGSYPNFQYVLKMAKGTYFMWAADDDEWDEHFIKTCVDNIGNHTSIMPNSEIKYRRDGRTVKAKLPKFKSSSPYQNLYAHLQKMAPCLFYGLHRREDILWLLETVEFFDWFDVYFINRSILTNGFKILPEYSGFTAGVDAEKYVVKPYCENGLDYMTFGRKNLELILNSDKLNTLQKVALTYRNLRSMIKLVSHHEKLHQIKAAIYLINRLKSGTVVFS
jgi:glycosyltransferase involved in cell wall biosynthesis